MSTTQQTRWTKADQRIALTLGFNIFDSEGQYTIQRIDNPEDWVETFGFLPKQLGSDVEAISAVKRYARSGEATCKKALALHGTRTVR